MNKVVHVVHCVDAEGPLFESLEAKFERLGQIFGISGIDHTRDNFEKLRRGEFDMGGQEELVKQVFSSHLSSYMDTWGNLDDMLDRAMCESFRTKITDSFGGPYLYSWFCLDHVGFETNPRRRTLGFHAIFDHYRDLLNNQPGFGDGLHWHFHPMSMYREAHRCATSLLNSPHIVETLARRIIERRWFPSCVRSGFQCERPDVHWFLEQYIPFDFTNTAVSEVDELEAQADLERGRFGDWRIAPKDWGVYHPSHDYYQLPGNCRRWIARALNVLNRFANIDDREVEKAFAQAQEGKPTLLAIASHDFRDLTGEVDHFRALLMEAARKYPDVDYKFCEAKEAFRAVAYPDGAGLELELKVELHRDGDGWPRTLTVDTVRGEVFGPQPFLAIKTRSQRYIHDNLDFSTDLRSWRYVFDVESVLPDDVAAIGIGANDKYGNTFVDVIVNTGWDAHRRSA